MITYCFLASNKTRAIVGGTIGSVLLIVIVTLICCIILVGKNATENKTSEIATPKKLNYRPLDLLELVK